MAYFPKSKIKIHDTPGGEFILKMKKTNYIGPYIEVSNGKYYTGISALNLGAELSKPRSKDNRFGGGKDFDIYLKLKKEPYKILSITKEIPSSKLPPKEIDYTNGFFIRYFIKRINHEYGYNEISKHTYKSLYEQSPSFDYRLYNTGQIKWFLRGNTEYNNNLNIKKQQRIFPFLNTLFSVPNEYQLINEEKLIQDQSFSYLYPSSGGGGGGY